MLRAAFTARSCVVPQPHVQSLTFNGSLSRTVPDAEHSLVEGNQQLAAAGRGDGRGPAVPSLRSWRADVVDRAAGRGADRSVR